MKLTPNKKFPKNTWLQFNYVSEDGSSPDYEENVSGKTPQEVMSGIMKEARISNAKFVNWQGLYHDDKELAGKKDLIKLAVAVSNSKSKLRKMS